MRLISNQALFELVGATRDLNYMVDEYVEEAVAASSVGEMLGVEFEGKLTDDEARGIVCHILEDFAAYVSV